jgi:hypothetical protein
MPKYEQAFVENEEAVEKKRTGKRKISLKLDSDGQIQWDTVSEDQKAELISGLLTDQDAQAAFKEMESTGAVEVGPLHFTSEHVGMLLDGVAILCRMTIPAIIKNRSKGIVNIGPEIASKAFRYTAEQKESLGPDGAAFLNEQVPESWKEWLLKIGPGARFFGGMAMCIKLQTDSAMELWKKNRPTAASATEPTPPTPTDEVVQ